MFFASDNTSPVAPQIMDALAKANESYRASYGNDDEMDEVRRLVREVFEAPQAEVYLVATGTTANVLSLATLVQPWQAIYCHRKAHIAVDECGAPEFYTGGAKLEYVDGAHGKMTPEALETAISAQVKGDVHSVQPGALSVTNVTEAGTVYTADELTALNKLAKSHGVRTHLDGSRFGNAVVSTGSTPAELSWKAGVDVLSFGGTKNGLMGAEAVILFDPDLAWEFELRRKRGGHLFSKHRYLSAQM
ncbi:MAG: aminotransferase class V-fold PLP-dependent enzyme, partial [Paracoccaceae bacterium]|nr:aminotransferase class V-fold PLP-dependent enzyme [Paracoccaceae bacterium]